MRRLNWCHRMQLALLDGGKARGAEKAQAGLDLVFQQFQRA
jgi:hypothetical protein